MYAIQMSVYYILHLSTSEWLANALYLYRILSVIISECLSFIPTTSRVPTYRRIWPVPRFFNVGFQCYMLYIAHVSKSSRRLANLPTLVSKALEAKCDQVVSQMVYKSPSYCNYRWKYRLGNLPSSCLVSQLPKGFAQKEICMEVSHLPH